MWMSRKYLGSHGCFEAESSRNYKPEVKSFFPNYPPSLDIVELRELSEEFVAMIRY